MLLSRGVPRVLTLCRELPLASRAFRLLLPSGYLGMGIKTRSSLIILLIITDHLLCRRILEGKML